MRVKASGLSDVGRARGHNEDAYGIDEDQRLYVVADGMGGHRHGEVASKIAVETIRKFVEETEDEETTWPVAYDDSLSRQSNRLKAAIGLAHDRVLRAIRSDGTLHGMGTTVVGLLLENNSASVAHVGDSRAYRLRGDRLELLTQDHTWVNEQVVAGYLSEEQARAHPLKNVVTRALGGEEQVAVDVQELDIEPGDVFLLCSDGLTTMLSDSEIKERLGSGEPVDEICRGLVEEANARGGIDNTTVVVVAFEAEEDLQSS